MKYDYEATAAHIADRLTNDHRRPDSLGYVKEAQAEHGCVWVWLDRSYSDANLYEFMGEFGERGYVVCKTVSASRSGDLKMRFKPL